LRGEKPAGFPEGTVGFRGVVTVKGNQMASVRTGGKLLRNFFLVVVVSAFTTAAFAQTPPYWNNAFPNNVNNVASAGCGYAGCAIKPAPWPADTAWVAYSWGTTYPDAPGNNSINDQRVNDPSNGGTTPQNYVNVSSGCPDRTLPSIYYFYDSTNKMIFFRWRVEQIANNYATGPSPGSFSSSSPWNSALWTVFLDLNGDGFRDFAAHLDGSSGSPSTPIDTLRAIWSPTASNSIDYTVAGNGIFSLFTNPTAFVQGSSGSTNNQLLQFSGGSPTTIQWPNGSSETIWDYGMTRSINISTSSCNEYFVDYEIPLAMLDASSINDPTYGVGKKLTEFTPFQFLFTTANSLNNPFQKDVVWEGNFVCDATSPGPFGDALTLAGGIIPQPITTSFTAGSANASCIVPLTAQIMDALNVTNCQTISELVQAQFKYYFDINGDGIDNDGGTWNNIGQPTVPVGTTVTANWDTSNLIRGQYLLALEITDNRGHTTQTWMGKATAPLTQSFGTDNNGPGGSLRNLYTNVPPFQVSFAYSGLSASTLGINYAKMTVGGGTCGASAPTVAKAHSAASVQAGGSEVYTLTITNTSATAVTVSSINDTLPTGFTYNSGAGTGGSLTPTGAAVVSGQTVTWPFSATIPACSGNPCTSTATFSFTTTAGSSAGTFFNTANVVTSVGTLPATDSSGVTVTTATVVATKTASLESNPSVPVGAYAQGNVIRFTITYTNNSTTTVNNINISDVIPTGLTYAGVPAGFTAPTSAPSVGSGGTVTWSGAWSVSGATLTPGQSFTVAFDATAVFGGSYVNSATVAGPPSNAPAVTASVPFFVSGPVLTIFKSATNSNVVVPPVAANPGVDYTIEYANVGNATANITTLTDTVPTGFTLVTGGGSPTPASCAQAGSLVTCTFNNTLTAGSFVSITLRFSVTAAATSPSTNTATINSSNASSKSTSFDTIIQNNTCVSSTYFFTTSTGAVSTGANGYAVGYVNMTNNGAGYTSAPAVSFTGGTGSGVVAASAGGAGNGQVLGVNVTTPGSGYTAGAPPTVVLTGGGFTTLAAATAVLTDNQFLASTTAGAANFTSATQTVGTIRELYRFYSPVIDSTTAQLISSASVTTGWNMISNGTHLNYTATLADWDPVNNTQNTISSVNRPNLNAGTAFTDTATLNPTAPGYILKAGHRLIWIFSSQDQNGSHATDLQFLFNGAASPFNSSGTVCMAPVRLGLTKVPSKLEVNATGDTLTYTIKYSNPSGATVTNLVISDPLPTGMTYTSAVPAPTTAPTVGTNGTVTWNVASLAAGASATLTLNVNIVSSIPAGTSTNTVSMLSDQTLSQTASAVVTVATPNVQITKVANRSAMVPGNQFDYTLRIINTGNAAATSVVVTDTIPSYFTINFVSTAATSIGAINLGAAGSAYTTASAVNFSGAGGATGAIATVNGSGGITAINLINPGSGYGAAPTISFGLPGSGATATTQLVGTLTSGSFAGQNVTFNVGSLAIGASAVFNVTATVKTDGTVPSGTTVATNTGKVVDAYNTTGNTASTSVTLTASPTLTLNQIVTTSAKHIVYIDVLSGGSYSAPPTVSFSGGGCSGAAAVVSTYPEYVAGISTGPYVVVGVTVTNGGTGDCTGNGLTGAPSVVFTGTGTAATAQAYVGPAPTDTITYQLTLQNTGNATATSCVINGIVPAFTSFFSATGGTFSGGSVTSTAVDLVPNGTSVLTYTVTVGSGIPTGPTSISQSGSATSTNAAAPSGVSDTKTTGAAPAYSISKSPTGNSVGFPLATLSASVSNSTIITVSSSTLISVGGTVAIPSGASYAIVSVISKSGTTVVLSAPITANSGATVYPVQDYSVSFSNTGGTSGTHVNVYDVLPANMLFAGIPTGAPAATSTPAIGTNGTIRWRVDSTLSTITINSGGTGYTSAPAVNLTGGGFTTAATAVATVSGGAVTSITLTNRGEGYTTAPGVSFSGGGGGGANATASIVTALPAGGTGSFDFLAFPTAANTYVNEAYIEDYDSTFPRTDATHDWRDATTTASTIFGALNPAKTTTTSQVDAGTTAHYVITVQNPLPGPGNTASNVIVTDNLPTGFTYHAGSTVINGSAAGNPGGTSTSPAWSGLSIAAGATLTIAFDADVASTEPTGLYQNEVLVSSSIPSLVFDYLGTTAEDVQVCTPPPTVIAPAVCGNTTGVVSVPKRLSAAYNWTITTGNATAVGTTTTVNSISISSGGSGYTTGSSVTISGGGGSGATASIASVNGSGAITSITINNPGSGYTSAPTVSFGAPGSGAAVTAVLGTGFLFTAGATGPIGLQVVITEGTCSKTQTASVTVNAAPSYTTNISDKNVCPGSSLTLTPSVTGTGGATPFQWYRSTNGGVSYTALTNTCLNNPNNCVSGATSMSLTVSNVNSSIDGNLFRLTAMNGSGCSLNSNAATLHVTCTLDLSVATNSATPDPVNAGSNLTLTQTVSNLSSVATTQTVTFSQSVPANTTFVSMTPPSGWTCSTPAVGGTGTVSCTTNGGVFLAANSTTSAFTFVVKVDPATVDGTTLTDTATVAVTAPDNDSVAANNTKSVSVLAQRRIDIAVVKDDDAFNSFYGPKIIYPGDPATSQPMQWFITVTNNGPSRATGVTLVDPMPTGFTYSSNLAATLTTLGSGYTSAPTVNVSGGGGSGANAVAILGGGVGSVTITNAGSGYTSAPTVGFAGGGGGSGATATAYLANGVVAGIKINNPGTGYTSAPTVSFGGGGGLNAAGTASITGQPGTIGSVEFTSVGTNYTSGPLLAFSGGSPTVTAVASASLCTYGSGNNTLTCTIGTLDPGQTMVITVAGTAAAANEVITNTATAAYMETDTNTANDSATDSVVVLQPTLVKMLTMDAVQKRNDNNVSIVWSTSYEVDNLGFYIWRSDATGAKTRLNKNIITGSALFNGKKLSGVRSYRFTDNGLSAGQFAQYWVEDVDLKGVHTMHGPVSPHVDTAAATTSGPITDPDPTVGSVGGIFTTASGMGVTAPTPNVAAATRLAQQWNISALNAAKLIVTQPGWYGVKKSDLVAAGFDPGTNGQKISVFADGVEVPAIVSDSNFGNDSTIQFYGTGIDTPSTGGHVYYVTSGTGQGLRVKNLTGKNGGGAAAPASYPFAFNRTERTVFFQGLVNNGERDSFYGAVITTYPTTESLTVANLDPSGADGKLELAIQAATDQMTHKMSVTLNGHDLPQITIVNQGRFVLTVPVPASWLANGDNSLTITATASDDDVSVVEYATLTYPHRYVADSNALAFTMPASVAGTVTGFTSATVRLVDLTDPQNPILMPVALSTAADGTKSIAFTTTGTGTRTLFAFGDDRVLPPAQIAVNLPSTLNATKNGADLVIITNKAFASAAATLQATRAAQGINTMVVDVQNVYDEFSYGEHAPEAIRGFLQRATSSWTKAPRYAILLGDACWDPRNYYGFGSADYVPTKLIATQYLKTASDDWFSDFNDTATPSVAIGRIPVRTLDDANGFVNKLVHRASTAPADPWGKTVDIISDYSSFVDFGYGADQLAKIVPAPYVANRISFAGAANPTGDVINAFNNGSLITNYIGHGSIEIWSHYVFSSQAAQSLTNGDKLPFVVTMNCLNGYFNDVWAIGLAEALVNNPSGGAIGAWASSALSSPDEQLRVNLELYRQIFGTPQPIGDAVLKAKRTTADRDVRMTWILFGDPTLRLTP